MKFPCRPLCSARLCFTLRKTDFPFLSHWIRYNGDDSFPSDSEPNGIQFDSKSKGKTSSQSYPIQFERKWESSFLSVRDMHCI